MGLNFSGSNPNSFPAWTAIAVLFIGAAIGSFLNVVIYRMPRGLSLGKPRHSFCPSCKNPLNVSDLIPLLSWVVLRGKCRQCGARIASRYFWVELLTGIIWVAIYWQYCVLGWDPVQFFAYAMMGSALVAVIFIDWQYYIIPDQVNAFMLGVGIVYNIYLYEVHDPRASVHGIPSALAGAVIGVGILWSIAFLGRILFKKDAMGHGDIKMARGTGAVLFPMMAVASFALAVVLGAVLGVVQILARRGGHEEEIEDEEEEADMGPEPIISLIKCGLGYLFCLDVVGLFFPEFYEKFFGESPFESVAPEESSNEPEISPTMIPFGPYLALGAIAASIWETSITKFLSEYWQWAGGNPAMMEHIRRVSGQ